MVLHCHTQKPFAIDRENLDSRTQTSLPYEHGRVKSQYLTCPSGNREKRDRGVEIPHPSPDRTLRLVRVSGAKDILGAQCLSLWPHTDVDRKVSGSPSYTVGRYLRVSSCLHLPSFLQVHSGG